MEQQYQSAQTYPQEVKPKAPVFVIIISLLMLLGGIGSLLLTAPLLLLGGIGKSGIIFGLGGLALIRGIGLVVVSFGIRHMRRWALYTFTALTVLAVGVSLYSFATEPAGDLTDFADAGIQALVLIYFGANSKKFT